MPLFRIHYKRNTKAWLLCHDSFRSGFFRHNISSSFLECRGCHFLGVFDEEVQKIQNRNKIPLVFIDSYSNVRQLINIGIDDYKGGQLAAEYFLKNGHKTLGFVGPFTKTGGVISKRYQGFSDTLLAHQITLFDKHVYDLEQMDPQVSSILFRMIPAHRQVFLYFPMKRPYN